MLEKIEEDVDSDYINASYIAVSFLITWFSGFVEIAFQKFISWTPTNTRSVKKVKLKQNVW